MLDRFSDGREHQYLDNDGHLITSGTTLPFAAADAGNAPRGAWVRAGQRFCGGTLRGLTTKIGYLERMGISAVWVSPIFKQLATRETYHGYGIQDFLDVDPRFGTRDDLRTFVDTAHDHGIRVILDVILNHTGDVFAYDPDRYPTAGDDGTTFMDPRWDGRDYRRSDPGTRAGGPPCHSDRATWPPMPMPSRTEQSGRVSSRRRARSHDADGSTTGTSFRSSWRVISLT